MPAIDGVAVGRILSILLDSNDAVWIELVAACFKGAADPSVILFSTSFLGL